MNELLSDQTGPEGLAQGMRDRLQEMTAVMYALEGELAGSGRAEEYLAVMGRAICGQLRLVRRLELSRRLSSRDEMRVFRAPMDLAALGRRVMEQTDGLTRPMLDIRAEFSTSLPALPALADEELLEAMLLEFISNSVGAIGRSGRVYLELEERNGQAVFTLTDTGTGLDPAALEGMFEPDGEETPTRGLALAWKIAQLHGGTLAAANTEAGGARVAVSIPIMERASGLLRSPAPPMDSGGWGPVRVALSGCLPAEAFRTRRSR